MSTVDEAVDALRRGELVVLPTDTVYGIAALPHFPKAVERIFEVKGRPPDKALPVLGADLVALRSVARFAPPAERVASFWWPGPLTLVLPRATGFDHYLGGERDGTIAVRAPDWTITQELLVASGPLAVTSANLSGSPAAVSVDQARNAFGDAVSVYLPGEPPGGHESTVVSLVGEPRVVREGAIPSSEILAML